MSTGQTYEIGYRTIIRLFLFATCWSAWSASAQQYNYLHYGLKEGLVQSQVKTLFQDSHGFLWAGTVGGVSRFDGRTFKNYTRQEGLLTNQISVITEDSKGAVVLGGSGTLSYIDGIGIRNIPLPSPLNEATVNSLLFRRDTLWVGTERGLCFVVSDQVNLASNALKDANIKAFVPVPSSEAIYILTKESVWKMDKAQATLHYAPMLSSTQFFDMASAGGGELWLATKGEGLIRLSADGLHAKNYLNHSELFTTNITSVVPDGQGGLWLSSRNGYFRFDGQNFESFDQSNGLEIDDVRDVLVDRENNLWIATYGGGLKRLASREMVSFTKRDGLLSNAVMSILDNGTGGFWLSTFDAGLHVLQHDTVVPVATNALNSRTWCSLADSKGRYWFGTSEGLLLKSNTWTLLTEEDGLSDNLVLSLLEDHLGQIWIGTSKGICVYKDEHIERLDQQDAPKSRVRGMAIDRLNQIWLATLEGVYKWSNGVFTHYDVAQGLSELSTYCIALDPHDRPWVGTAFGLCMWNGSAFESRLVSPINGGNVINFIVFHQGKVWLGSNEGLAIASVREELSLRQYTFKHFDINDGLISNETNLNSAYVDRFDRLWFGTSEGLMQMPTSLIEQPAASPPGLQLYDLQINLTPQNWNGFGLERDVNSGLPIGLTLPYNQNDLTFYFTGVSITFPETVEYQYMLEGFDDGWKPATPNAFATYSALPHNDYTFVVRTRHKDGIWSEPVKYTFAIQPPFWLRWWFLCIVLLAVAAVVGWFIHNRTKILRSRREKETFELKNRLLALEQQSLNSSMNRHFIFNALNSIQYYINRQDRLAANKYLSDFAKLIRKNLDSSQDNLTTLNDEIERLEIYLRLEHMRFKDKFEYEVKVDPKLSRDKIKVPAMLIQPFLENSIWHGLLPKDDGEVGHLAVHFAAVEGHVELEIRDNGIGIENSLKRKTGADSHISKGMEITQSRIDLIKKTTGKTIELIGPQDIKGEDGLSKGTIVKIKLSEDFHELF